MRSHKKITKTADVPKPNKYIDALLNELSDYAFDESRVPGFKGRWREEVFAESDSYPIDLEIGTGNGYHFAHRAKAHPERGFLGMEIKYKPLIQSIKRALNDDSTHCRMLRFHANEIETVFSTEEIDNVFIHFPDPWPKKRHFKNRLIQEDFLDKIFAIQREGSFLEFKTDSYSYFEWAMERFEKSKYRIDYQTEDLHASSEVDHSFLTHFEKIFVSKGIPINYVRLVKI